MKNIQIIRVMWMVAFTDDFNQVKKEFCMLKNIFETLKIDYFSDSDFFTEISMGMSDDYEVAVGEGSTIIRVGSKIFGVR